MAFSHILITRPRPEASELAEMLAPCMAETIILPAYEFHASELFPDQLRQMQRAVAEDQPALLVFTSTRSVEYGLGQVPPGFLRNAQIAAIGPATASLLKSSGVGSVLRSNRGYSSEDLLECLQPVPPTASGRPPPAFILAAPGGRTALNEGLQALGYEPHMLMVYERVSATMEAGVVARIERAGSMLVVWTSANTMTALSQRLPARTWDRVCRAEWLVISERLRRLALVFSPGALHLAAGPTNHDIFEAVQAITERQ